MTETEDTSHLKQLAQIDQMFIEVILRMERDGLDSGLMTFIGIQNLCQYAFANCPNAAAVCSTALGAILTELEKRVPTCYREDPPIPGLESEELH